MWRGQAYFTATDYNSCAILKHCSLDLKKSKYMSCEGFICVTKWNI